MDQVLPPRHDFKIFIVHLPAASSEETDSFLLKNKNFREKLEFFMKNHNLSQK